MPRISAPSAAPVETTSTSRTTSRLRLETIGILRLHGPILKMLASRGGPGKGTTCDGNLAQGCVDLVERGGARTEGLFVERIERRRHRVEMAVQVFRLRIDVKQAGDDLALRSEEHTSELQSRPH